MKSNSMTWICTCAAMLVYPLCTPVDAVEIPELDPLLKKAYLAYQDPNKPRSEIIPLFEEYAQKNPESIFLPEVYYRIGALYSIHRKPRLGEQKDLSLQRVYYQKAHSLYGEKYTFLNQVAWSSLIGGHDIALEARKAYLDWLLRLQSNATVEDIYPIRDIGQVLNGMVPERSPEEMQGVLTQLRRNIGSYIYSTERNIFWFEGNKYASLVDLAASYPDTELGRQAAKRVRQADEYFLRFADPTSADPNADHSSAVPDRNRDIVESDMSLGPVSTAKEIFLPRFEVGSKQGQPAILDLATGELIQWPNLGLRTEQMHQIAVQQGRGDLAWDGELVLIRGGELLNAQREFTDPLGFTKSESMRCYDLPKNLKLPCRVVIVQEGTSYLMSIRSIQENGIKVSYIECTSGFSHPEKPAKTLGRQENP